MGEFDNYLIVLRGGAHDGNSTTVAEGVRRLLTPSEAPGLLDVYEPAEIWEFSGQESIERVTTEHGLALEGHDVRAEGL